MLRYSSDMNLPRVKAEAGIPNKEGSFGKLRDQTIKTTNNNKYVSIETKNLKDTSMSMRLGGPKPKNGKKSLAERMYAAAWEEKAEAADLYSDTRNDPLEYIQVSEPQVDAIPVGVEAIPENVWDFCVSYVLTAMNRRQDATETFDLNNGTPIGLYYFTALTLYYTIYQVSIGEIPILQRINVPLRNLLQAASPVITRNRAMIVTWPDNIQTMISSLPYNAYTNPALTTAPQTSVVGPENRPLLQIVVPGVTLEDIRDRGPDAFEIVQRYLLGEKDHDNVLVDYTTDGPYIDNVSLFSFARDNNADRPVKGFNQLVNEVRIPAKDMWLLGLQFYGSDKRKRDGWSTRTVRKGTHMAMYYILTGVIPPLRTDTQQVSLAVIVGRTISELVAAAVNSNQDQTLNDIGSLANFVDGYLTELNAGQLINSIAALVMRRFSYESAMCAGTPMYDAASSVIGAGSAFLTTQAIDFSPFPMDITEQIADLSRAYNPDAGYMKLPVLIGRGEFIALDATKGGSLLEYLINLYPSLSGVGQYDLRVTTPSDLPDYYDITNVSTQAMNQGPVFYEGLRSFASVVASLQFALNISDALDGRDGCVSQQLWLTHVLDPQTDGSGFDKSFWTPVSCVLSTGEMSGTNVAGVLARMMPVVFITEQDRPAFQVLMNEPHFSEIDLVYAQVFGPEIVQHAHKRASNLLAPSENSFRSSYKTIVEEGGLFHDVVSGAIHGLSRVDWVKAIDLLGQGLGNFLGPKMAKATQHLQGKTGRDLKIAFARSGLSHHHLAPVHYGLVSHVKYLNAYHQLRAAQDSGQVFVAPTRKIKSSRGQKNNRGRKQAKGRGRRNHNGKKNQVSRKS